MLGESSPIDSAKQFEHPNINRFGMPQCSEKKCRLSLGLLLAVLQFFALLPAIISVKKETGHPNESKQKKTERQYFPYPSRRINPEKSAY